MVIRCAMGLTRVPSGRYGSVCLSSPKCSGECSQDSFVRKVVVTIEQQCGSIAFTVSRAAKDEMHRPTTGRIAQ